MGKSPRATAHNKGAGDRNASKKVLGREVKGRHDIESVDMKTLGGKLSQALGLLGRNAEKN